MEKFTCIAVDMGAGSIRVMLGVLESGGISYNEIHRFSNEIVEIEGKERWDMAHMISEIRKGIKKAVAESKDPPLSIGVDSWGVDFVLLDDEGQLLEIPVAYRDSRTEGMQELWAEVMPERETFERTGINFYIFNTLFQLFSIKDSELLKKASRILFLPSYLNYVFSGVAQNELTISSTSQVLGVKNAEWDTEICQKLELDPGLLGKVIPPGTRLGPVVIKEAEGTGMESIAVCGHDTACAVAAIPVDNPNYAYISAGTWCIVGIESETPLISQEAQRLGLTNERGYNNTYRTLKNIVGLWLLQGLKKQLPGHATFADMEQMAQSGGEILQVIDPDDPGFYNPEDMKEAFDTYFEKTGQPKPLDFAGYLLCAYDSLCFSFRYHIEELEKMAGRSIEVLHVIGGGSQSEILNQKIADICKRKVVSGPVEGATLGNILVQAMAMGKIENLEKGRLMIRNSCTLKTYLPAENSHQTEEHYNTYLLIKKNQQ